MLKKKTKNKKKENIYAILAIIILLVISSLAIKFISAQTVFFKKGVDRTKCPYKTEGNPNSTFTIKYIDSPYCVWCWFEEPVLKNIVKAKGNSFRLERYDIRYCTDIVQKYRFSGTPSFVFSLENKTKEYSHSGFVPEEDFNNIICEVTGNCDS